MNDVTIGQIEKAAEKFSTANLRLCDEVKKLTDKVDALNRAISRVKERHMVAIRAAAKTRQERKEALELLINKAPRLFVDPRTFYLHGVKIGLRWSKGSLEIPDEEKTIALIEEHFAPMAKILIKIKKTAVKNTIKALPLEDIQKLEVKIIGAGDQTVIEPCDGVGIEETVSQLIKEKN